MTSDIVQRLRAVAGERYSEGANKGGTAGLLEDAAYEIDRLRAENAELREPLGRVAALNPDAGEIGDGMLRTIVSEARTAIGNDNGRE